mmetsp:Transcript_17945/g.30020  ORF Transcript_17945/g.30020 Transcript_17945/m.30020 type:complete len:236 (-) Transcript_17945:438-1145(-)
MSGNNHNMNHIVKRIETRVLAPPGGFSSISFGGGSASGDIYRGHDFNPKTNKQLAKFPKESTVVGQAKQPASRHQVERGSRNRSQQQQERAPTQQNNIQANIRRAKDLRDQKEKENKMRSVNRERRDSLDDLIATPHHPQKQSSGCELPSSYAFSGSEHGGGRGQQHHMAKSDYAEALRQQIATKKSLTGEGLHARPPQQGQYEHQHQYQQQSTTNRRAQYGSGAGRSSISLSWD